MTQLTVSPRVAKITETISVFATGLEPLVRHDVTSSTRDGNGVEWRGRVSVLSDQDGAFNLATAEPLEGSTYTEPDAMGVFWSMRPTSGARFHHRADRTYEVVINLEIGQRVLATETTTRRFGGDSANIQEIEDEKLHATLVTPSEREPPYPVVVGLHGSAGGRTMHEGLMLAEQGIASLNVTYFGMPGLPSTLRMVPLEYFQGSVDFLVEHPEVDSDRIGVFGQSRGGEAALLAAAHDRRLKVVVALVGSGVAWQAVGFGEPVSTWSLEGRPVPFARFTANTYLAIMRLSFGKIMNRPKSFKFFMNAEKLRSDTIDGARIHVENINGPVLLVSADDDQVWDSTGLSQIAMDRLSDHQFEAQHLIMREAGHRVADAPGFPTYGPDSTRIQGFPAKFGGTPQQDAKGSQKLWQETFRFLREHL